MKHPFQTHNKINWHAFGGDEERFNAGGTIHVLDFYMALAE